MPVPVQSRSEGNLYSGEKRAELHVVPKFAVAATPGDSDRAGCRRAAPPATCASPSSTMLRGPAPPRSRCSTPQGWSAAPATQALTFSREDEAGTVRFTLTPPAR